LMDSLLMVCAVQIRRVVSKVSVSAYAANAQSDLEDCCGNAMLNLYKALLRWKSESNDERPVALKPYVNQIARNVFHDQMRESHPTWFKLASKVLLRLRNSGRFVVTDEEENRLCALTETAAKEPLFDRQQLGAVSAGLRRERDWSREPLEELLEALLSAAGHPLPFDTVVDLALRCTGEERGVRSLDEEIVDGVPLGETISHGGGDPEQETREAELLRWTWDEMGELPENQRQVCGLNLEAAVGIRLEVFVLRRVADKQKYETLIRALKLKDLPGFPPFTDPVIGGLQKTDAKRVSNARVSAQRRLKRRILEKEKVDGSNRRVSASWEAGVHTRL
jgi:DNA-directed RNA polymerase specialized sigma24 family protein